MVSVRLAAAKTMISCVSVLLAVASAAPLAKRLVARRDSMMMAMGFPHMIKTPFSLFVWFESLEQGACMVQRPLYHLEAFKRPLGAAWQVDDQASSTDSRNRT